MRTSGWMKRQSWFWPVKLFLKRVSGHELWLKTEIDVASTQSADWNYIADRLDEDSVAYSLGVGDSIDFDLDIIEKTALAVHAFDPTPYAMEWVQRQTLPVQFVFHPWAASGKDGSLRLYRRVNNRGKRAKVMWTADSNAGDPNDFIDSPAYTIDSIMKKLDHLPEQLLIEFHHRFPGIGRERTAAGIKKLKRLGYRIFSISETGREVGFLLSGATEPR